MLRNEFASLCSELDFHVELEQGPEDSLLWPADVFVKKAIGVQVENEPAPTRLCTKRWTHVDFKTPTPHFLKI